MEQRISNRSSESAWIFSVNPVYFTEITGFPQVRKQLLAFTDVRDSNISYALQLCLKS